MMPDDLAARADAFRIRLEQATEGLENDVGPEAANYLKGATFEWANAMRVWADEITTTPDEDLSAQIRPVIADAMQRGLDQFVSSVDYLRNRPGPATANDVSASLEGTWSLIDGSVAEDLPNVIANRLPGELQPWRPTPPPPPPPPPPNPH